MKVEPFMALKVRLFVIRSETVTESKMPHAAGRAHINPADSSWRETRAVG
jgi:hypothetical protein